MQPGAVDGLAQLEVAAARLLEPPQILEGGLEVRQADDPARRLEFDPRQARRLAGGLVEPPSGDVDDDSRPKAWRCPAWLPPMPLLLRRWLAISLELKQ